MYKRQAPEWLHGIIVLGAYSVLSWVVAVMLPPMAIFFPLFTRLEDVGYLPRIAYNLDKPFKKCRACGKQALCMEMCIRDRLKCEHCGITVSGNHSACPLCQGDLTGECDFRCVYPKTANKMSRIDVYKRQAFM